MKSSLSVNISIVDITFAIDQKGYQTVKFSFPDEAVQWCISIRVQSMVILCLKQ